MDTAGESQDRSALDGQSADKQQSRLAAWFGVPSLWTFTAVIPFLVTVIVTQSAYWGLVGMLATFWAILVVSALGVRLPVRDQTGFGLTALAGWLGAAFIVSDGSPQDSDLLNWFPVGLAVFMLLTDFLQRRRTSTLASQPAAGTDSRA